MAILSETLQTDVFESYDTVCPVVCILELMIAFATGLHVSGNLYEQQK